MLEDILNCIQTAKSDELGRIIKAASAELDKRAERRKKELWDNIIASIKEYEKEVDSITFYCQPYGEDFTFDCDVEAGMIQIS